MSSLNHSNYTYYLPDSERNKFKNPIDVLFKEKNEIIEQLNALKSLDSSAKIYSVGDQITQSLLEIDIHPHIIIIDGYIQRKKAQDLPQLESYKEVSVVNKPAHIEKNAWKKIQQLVNLDEIKTIIKITGEEDLLVLPAILEAPLGTKVLYGQPNEGIVIVTVTEKKKIEIEQLMEKMVKVNGT